MANFEPQEFLETKVTGARLVKLDKPKQWKRMKYLELGASEEAKKPELILSILANCNPDEEEKEHDRREREKEREPERLKISMEKSRLALGSRCQDQREAFDVNKCFSLVPKFDPERVKLFFELFKKIAKQRDWPEHKWVTLIQGSLTRKAQEAYVALDIAQMVDYGTVREAVPKAYELVPESYRQHFRTERIQPGQTYLDFARQQEVAFDKWLRASTVYDFKGLRFKQGLPKVMQTYLSNLDVKTVSKAAETADNYVLIHKDSWRDKPSGLSRRRV